MNLKYLHDIILPQRRREIEEGKNHGTRQPIYVVMDVRIHVVEESSEYLDNTTNLAGRHPVAGFIDLHLPPERRKFKKHSAGMNDPQRLTRFFTDYPVAFFLTSKGAHEYLQYQKHNLSERAYVFVFYTGYANYEMDELFGN